MLGLIRRLILFVVLGFALFLGAITWATAVLVRVTSPTHRQVVAPHHKKHGAKRKTQGAAGRPLMIRLKMTRRAKA